MFLLLSLVTLLIAPSHGSTGSFNRLKLLKFADNGYSYIRFSPDWSALTDVVSACGWIKDLGSASYRGMWSRDGSWEMTVLADAKFVAIAGSYMHSQSEFSVPKGTWYHMCSTWSRRSRTHRHYINGKELGSRQTADRSLSTSLPLILGRWGTSTGHPFGGEMLYLNFYSKELSPSAIVRMVEQGMCANIVEEDAHESFRVIKWEDLVKLERSGTVTDVSIAECVDFLLELSAKLKESERKLKETVEELTETRQELNSTFERLEETQADNAEKEQHLEDISSRLNSTLLELEKSQAQNAEKEQNLEDISSRLNSTLAELEEVSSSLNRTWDWDIFLSGQFLNQTFTDEHSLLLHTTWDDIAGTAYQFTTCMGRGMERAERGY